MCYIILKLPFTLITHHKSNPRYKRIQQNRHVRNNTNLLRTRKHPHTHQPRLPKHARLHPRESHIRIPQRRTFRAVNVDISQLKTPTTKNNSPKSISINSGQHSGQDFDANDIGIDLVAKERHGGYCAIQCKCYAENTRISKPAIDSFIAASASERFTSRLIVDTGGEWGPNALRTIDPIKDKLRIIRYSDLESSPFDWPDLSLQDPGQLAYKQRRFHLKDHQKEAFDDVINGFKEADRGKLIMACGTGKTFTALKIAEEIAGTEGRVLYLVPSIGLLSQAMREWSDQRGVPHSYIGICSDTHAGSTSEDASIQELKIPVTTDPSSISHTLQNPDSGIR